MSNPQKRSARLLELMPLIKAHAEGKIIEFKRMDGIWTECYANGPSWSAGDEYRVKPEPRMITVLLNSKGINLRSWNNWQEYSPGVETAEQCLKRMNDDLGGYTLVSFTENAK